MKGFEDFRTVNGSFQGDTRALTVLFVPIGATADLLAAAAEEFAIHSGGDGSRSRQSRPEPCSVMQGYEAFNVGRQKAKSDQADSLPGEKEMILHIRNPDLALTILK